MFHHVGKSVKKQPLVAKRDLDLESVKRRTELFTKYVLPYKRLIYSICIKYSFNENDIEDNYSEVLVNFFKYIETYNPERPIKTWIYAVTQRHVFDLNRRNGGLKTNDSVDVADLANLLDMEHVSTNCMGMENYREYYSDSVLLALERLAPIHKEALLLQQAGYKMEEIVEISFQNGNLKSKNMETIKSRIFLAKKQMRNLITRDGDARKE